MDEVKDLKLKIALGENILFGINQEIGAKNKEIHDLNLELSKKDCFGLRALQIEKQRDIILAGLQVLEVHRKFVEEQLESARQRLKEIKQQEKEAKKKRFKIIK